MSRSALFLRLRMLVLSVFMLGTLFLPLAGSAQGTSSFVLNSAVRQCDASVVDLGWSATGTIASMTISVSNTSSNWSDQTVLTGPIASNSHSYTFDHHAIDKVVVRVVTDEQYPRVFQYSADVGTCDVAGSIAGGRIGDDTANPDFPITIDNATCTGFNWSVQAPYEVRVYVSVMDILGRGMIPYVPVNGTDLSRSETYIVDSDERTNFNILITVYDLATDQELARKSLSKSCPIASAPTVTPGMTPAVTPDVDDQQPSVTIQINLPGGESIVGAPYSVFAPMAAQFMAEPYLQGVVGPNNTIELVGLMPGNYRLLIEPVGMDPIDLVFTVGTDQVTEIVLQLDADGNATVVTPQPVLSPMDPPAEGTSSESAAAASQSVDTLPSTGAGGMQMGTPILLLGMLIAMLGMVGIVTRRGLGIDR